MVATVDLILEHAAQIVTPGGSGPLKGSEQGRLEVVPDGAVAIAGGRVVAVGTTSAVRSAVGIGPLTQVWDASGHVLTPGLVDAHTHLVHAGDRVDEFELRAKGAGYAEILAAGGGIHHTVSLTREASFETLAEEASRRLDGMLRSGTTTVEAKSGYGLDLTTELRQIEVMGRGLAAHPIDVVPTFMGAHSVPSGHLGDSYIDFLITDVLPAVAAQGIAKYCDVFCERGVFTIAQSERLLRAASELGLIPKLHADELADTGGATLAAQVGAVSADHLHHAGESGLQAMANAGTIAVLLPGTATFLGLASHAPARRMIDLGVPVALGTDLNPGSCPCDSMALIMSLAVTQLKMTPGEALVAATCNAAASCGLGESVGRLASGFQADVVAWRATDYRAISYRMGANLATAVIKRGRIAAGSLPM